MILRGDALRLPLRDESVDLIVTSPPYFALRSYRDGAEHFDGQLGSEPTPQAFLEALWAVTAECQRVLKRSGSMFVNLGDKYAGSGGHNNAGLVGASVPPPPGVTIAANGHGARRRNAPDAYNKATIGGARPKSLMGLPWRYANGCVDGMAGDPLILRAEIVWEKRNGLPESVDDRVRRSHEQWFHMTKDGDYYAGIDEIRQPHAAGIAESVAADNRPALRPNIGGDGFGRREWRSGISPLGKLPGSVWTVATEPLSVPDYFADDDHGWRMMDRGPLWRYVDHRVRIEGYEGLIRVGEVDHYAAFPSEWPRRLILGWSPPGAVVLDPFSGTGTTIGVARALGRVGIGVDLSLDYCRLARWLLRDGKRYRKAASRTDAERQAVLL